MITIVSGIPGSGTLLMTRMLEAGGMLMSQSGVDRDGLPGAREKQVSWLDSLEGKACSLAPEILFDLPASREYRVIFMLRDLDSIVASSSNRSGHDNGSKAALPPEMVRHGLERRLRRIIRWLEGPRRMAAWFCDFEQVLLQPLATARRAAAFLGIRLDISAMAAVVERQRFSFSAKEELDV